MYVCNIKKDNMSKLKSYLLAIVCMVVFIGIIDEYSQVGGLTVLDVVEAFIWSWVVLPLVVIGVYLIVRKEE